MAFKKYAYYNRGNKFALIESDEGTTGGNLAVAHCTLGGYSTKDTCEAAGGQWIPSSSSSNIGKWEKYISPKEAVIDGIEIEYAYVPTYRINDDSENVEINSYTEATGLVRLTLASNQSFTADTYVVITGFGKLNGLHQVSASTSTTTTLILKTKYSGELYTFRTDDKPVLYKDVSALTDEDFELDLTEYQAQAVIYYLKAKMAEEMMDIERREYFMRLFNKQIEKAASSRKKGPYIMQSFGMKNY